jgi:hypothetical protein
LLQASSLAFSGLLTALGPFFELFFRKSGPRGTQQKKLQELDSMSIPHKNVPFHLPSFHMHQLHHPKEMFLSLP